MNFFYLFKYYLYIFFILIIFQSNYYNNNIILKNFNHKIINHTYNDYLFWKEGKKIKKFNIPLLINTFYNKNSIKKEKLELISYNNILINNKIYNNNITLIPNLDFSYKKYYNYISKKDISYFNVKTPTTQLFYEKSNNGHLFQTIFTQSPQKNINYSINYKFFYPKNITNFLSTNYFLTTFNYNDIENKYYKILIHFINHNIKNDEYNNINLIHNKRVYIGQYFNLNKIYLINRLEYEKKNFIYKEKKYINIFGNVYINQYRKNEKYFHKISNNLIIKFFLKKNIFLLSGIGFYKLLFNPLKNKKTNFLLKEIKNNIFTIFFNLESKLNSNINFNLFVKYFLYRKQYNTYYFFLKTKYNIFFNSKIETRFLFYTINPSFNTFFNKSFYKKNNYFNKFNNIEVYRLFCFYKKNYNYIYFNIYNINNYIFFVKKFKQKKNKLKILNFNIYNSFSYKKIRNNIFFKIQNNNYKNYTFLIPNFIIKNYIYYEDLFFKKKMLFQTGIIFNFFTKKLINKNNYLINNNITSFKYLDYFINIEFFRIKVYFFIQKFNKEKIQIKFGFLWNMFT